VIDRDNDDCIELKHQLNEIAGAANLKTRSSAGGGTYNVANRLAIEELEAWYFGGERNHQGLGNRLVEPGEEIGRVSGPVQCRRRLGVMLRY
jgi:hypothetical protein